MDKQPKQCMHSDCFTCPYDDCIFDQMTIDEYLESINRDREISRDSGLKKEYQQKSFDCSGRKEYFRKRYQQNRERMLRLAKEYRKRIGHKDSRDRSEYFKEYYQKHREKKIRQSIERNKIRREALNATG